VKKIIHWIVSIAAATWLALLAILCVGGIGYALYLLVTKATIVLYGAMVFGVAYGVVKYIEDHGWAWNPHDDSSAE
jgi:hypothetical protein